MNDDKDKKTPEAGEERTVFMPSGGGGGAPAGPIPAEPVAAEPPTEPAPAAEPQTPPADDKPAEASAAPPGPPAEAAGEVTSALSPTAIQPRAHAKAIQVGDVLNHIFKVNRFLARGGMGEVFEGCNVNTDEKVAIKVMLPALAADEKVVAMFRKEARTLTKLHHECIVQYRVLAQEPELGVLYIVTDYIDGKNLADVLDELNPSPEELVVLLQRLAAGLAAAHRMELVHRDMSPDNVILPGGDLRQAKIIDFGIAKDLDASSATIVGDGFAGKLNYVAPEQLGDFGREVGAWTDVYSLGLVILAVAQGRNVNMSGSLVDAIDKRRKGPDLAAVPGNIRPVLEAMLRPDPKDRLRSMDEVLAMVGGTSAPRAAAPEPAAGLSAPRGGPPLALIIGGVLLLALLIGAGAWYYLNRGGALTPVRGDGSDNISGKIESPSDPVTNARNAVTSVLPSVTCTWLDIGSVENSGGTVSVAMRGVAGNTEAAQQELTRALSAAGLANARVDFGDVAQILPAGCAALDTYRQVRASARHLSVAQPRFEMAMQPQGQLAAPVVLELDAGTAGTDFAFAGIEPSGIITPLLSSRGDFQAEAARSVNGRPIADLGNGRYRITLDVDHVGWSGLMLVTGQGPFVPDLVAPPIGARGPGWQQQFLSAAAQGNWRVEMVWFESVNREPDGAVPSASPGAPDKP